MKTTSGWSAKLTRSIVLKDGTRLVTLGDVRAFILKQPEHIQERRARRKHRGRNHSDRRRSVSGSAVRAAMALMGRGPPQNGRGRRSALTR